MKVDELIHELAQYRGDMEVRASLKYGDKHIKCPECGNEIKVDGDDAVASGFNLKTYGSHLYIEVKE